MKTKKSESIVNKNLSKRCINCENIDGCEEIATVSYPILSNKDKILGVIGFNAFNQKQQIYINENLTNINLFLKKLSSLLASHLIYEKNINNICLRNKELVNTINFLEQGILIVNENKKILHFNKKALFFLKCSQKDLLEKNIEKIFFNFKLEENIEKEFFLISNLNYFHEKFIGKIFENKVNYKIKSYIIKFSRFSKIVKVPYNFLNVSKEISFDKIIAESSSMKNAINLTKQVCKAEVPILLRGEFGSEIDIFANAIHNFSLKRKGAFVTIDFQKLSYEDMEKQLFGIEKYNNKNEILNEEVGMFELAKGGSVYLKNIVFIPKKIQKKILEMLKNKSFKRINGKNEIVTDFNLITATTKKLEEFVIKEEFLIDLYYAINVIPINIPPLRERGNDIILLAELKIKELCKNKKKEEKILSEDVKKIFLTAYWKGNIVELKNIVEYAIDVSTTDVIEVKNLPQNFFNINNLQNETNKNYNIENILKDEHTLEELNSNFEKAVLNFYLTKYRSNIKAKEKISKILDINLSTLYRKLSKYNLD